MNPYWFQHKGKKQYCAWFLPKKVLGLCRKRERENSYSLIPYYITSVRKKKHATDSLAFTQSSELLPIRRLKRVFTLELLLLHVCMHAAPPPETTVHSKQRLHGDGAPSSLLLLILRVKRTQQTEQRGEKNERHHDNHFFHPASWVSPKNIVVTSYLLQSIQLRQTQMARHRWDHIPPTLHSVPLFWHPSDSRWQTSAWKETNNNVVVGRLVCNPFPPNYHKKNK